MATGMKTRTYYKYWILVNFLPRFCSFRRRSFPLRCAGAPPSSPHSIASAGYVWTTFLIFTNEVRPTVLGIWECNFHKHSKSPAEDIIIIQQTLNGSSYHCWPTDQIKWNDCLYIKVQYYTIVCHYLLLHTIVTNVNILYYSQIYLLGVITKIGYMLC